MSALELRQVEKARGLGRQRVQVLRGIDLAVEPGEVVLLEGPSGAGKSTLLTVAAGLLAPDKGEVVLGGRELLRLGPAAQRALRARTVGFVFQRANLLEALNVRENILVAAEIAGIPGREAEREAERLMEALGISRLGARRIGQLSGGEEQRVAVARALVHRPAVVFADEPTGSLDGEAGRAVAEALSGLAQERGVAVLIATHDPRLGLYATRRVRIEDGRLFPVAEEHKDPRGV
jgi:putative ABC transport system ATP-binding protein